MEALTRLPVESDLAGMDAAFRMEPLYHNVEALIVTRFMRWAHRQKFPACIAADVETLLVIPTTTGVRCPM